MPQTGIQILTFECFQIRVIVFEPLASTLSPMNSSEINAFGYLQRVHLSESDFRLRQRVCSLPPASTLTEPPDNFGLGYQTDVADRALDFRNVDYSLTRKTKDIDFLTIDEVFLQQFDD